MKITYISYGHTLGTSILVVQSMKALRILGPELTEYHLHPDFRNPLLAEPKSDTGPPQKRISSSRGRWSSLFKLLRGTKDAVFLYLGILLRNLRAFPRELRIISREKPDLLFVRKSFVVSSLLIAKLKKIPFVWDMDTPLYEKEKFSDKKFPGLSFLEFLDFKTHQWADALTVVSSAVKDDYVKKGMPPEKIFVCPNGVDPQRFSLEVCSRRVKEKLGLEGKLVIGFSGGFSAWHGIDTFLESLPTLADCHPEARFLLVGGTLGGAYEDKVKSPYASKVIFTGQVSFEKIPEYLAAMDITVAPYPPIEFFYFSPLKIFEYMAMGKPVVTSKQGQLAEVITDGENGLLFEPGNQKEMLDQIKRLIDDVELRRRLGANARKTVVENYTWGHRAQRALEACRYALSRHRTNLN
jgi:glycosyltransferase involved in cell wall biosynthesis